MRLNLFEGSRRILYLILILVAVVGAFVVFDGRPSVQRNYAVSTGLDNKYIYSWTSRCSESAETTTYSSSEDRYWLHGYLCFDTVVTKAGKRIIVLRRDDDGAMWGAEVGSEAMTELKQKAEDEFQAPVADAAGLSEAVASVRRSDLWQGAGFTLVAVVSVWLLGCVIGWIVRGFLGIPFRKDFRSVPGVGQPS